MERACFTFEIYPDKADEYKKRHDEIWPELVEAIQDAGLKNYSLFRHGNKVIAYVECHPDIDTAFRNTYPGSGVSGYVANHLGESAYFLDFPISPQEKI